MSVIRVKKTENFVTLYKHCLQNPELSFKAKGLWAYCMSMPNDWTFRVAHLATVSKEGEDAVYSAIKELEKAGYVKKVQKNINGKFQAVDYEVYEFPLEIQKILPQPDFPLAGFPDAGNPPLLNNDSTKDLKETKERGGTSAPPAPPNPPSISSSKKIKEEKKELAERVWITQSQHDSLVKRAQGNIDLVKMWYDELSTWKIGKEIFHGKNDYQAIIKWVIDAVKTNPISSKSSGKQSNHDWAKEIHQKLKNRTDIEVGEQGVLFILGNFSQFFKYEENAFREQVIARLRKMNIDVSSIST